jgi:hypothetical protein
MISTIYILAVIAAAFSGAVGYPRRRHSSRPPSKRLTLSIPFFPQQQWRNFGAKSALLLKFLIS